MSITGLGGLSGMVSGMDTKTLINQLMQIESQPLYQMQQRKHVQDLKKGLYSEVNAALLALQSKLQALTDPAVINKKSVTSADAAVAAASISNAAQAVAGTYDVSVTNLATAFDWRTAAQTSATAALNLSGSFTLDVDGVVSQTIDVTTSDSLTSIASKINASLDASGNPMKVTATVVDTTLIIQAKDTGASHTVKIPGSGGTPNSIAQSLGLVDSTDTQLNVTKGTDASFSVNGISMTRSSNTNLTDVVSGLSISLLKSTSSTTFTVAQDVDSTKNSIREFVDQYNKVLDLLSTRLTEKKIPNARTDFELGKGLLNGDPTLISIQTELKNNIANMYSGSSIYKTLHDIGVQVDTTIDGGKSGKLMIDETKLSNALTRNPQEVMKLFFTDTNGNGRLDQSDVGAAAGVAATVYNKLDGATSSSTELYGNISTPKGLLPAMMTSIDRIMSDYDDKMESFTDRLEQRRRSLERQFSSLEVLLAQSQSQGNYMSQQLLAMNR